MGWTAGATKTTGDLITAAIWNSYMGGSGSLDYLKGSPTLTSIELSTTGTGTGAQLKLTRTSAGSRYIWIGGSLELAIGDSAGTQHFNFMNTGYVGINCTSPSAMLDIVSNANDIPGLEITQPTASTKAAVVLKNNTTEAIYLYSYAAQTWVQLKERDLGNDAPGPALVVGANIHVGGVGPAAGALDLMNCQGTNVWYWTDTSSILRTHTLPPTGDVGHGAAVVDNSGTVVGDQTSWHEEKTDIKPWDRFNDCLRAVLDLPLFSFRYKQSSYKEPDGSDREFVGPVIFEKDKPLWYGKNMGPQQIPCLDEVTSIGYLIGAVKELARQVTELKAELAALKG
jgi:hypothetical protein